MRAIELVAYDPAWPAAFARLHALIENRIGDLLLEVHHVGSTSVPGLAAKPKIDIDAVARSEDALAAAVGRMKSLDYAHHGDPHGNGMWSFTRSHGPYGERLYLCAPGNAVHADRLRFRDCLRAHPASAAAYEALKRRLAVEAAGDWDRYTGGKAPFIAEMLRLSVLLPESDRTQAHALRLRA